MTDHPSNPPSQEMEELIGQALDRLIEHDETTTDSEADRTECFANNRKVLLGLIDSAIAAQEARHKAAMEEAAYRVRKAETRDDLTTAHLDWLLPRRKAEKLEAESKLRGAMEREKVLVEASRNLLDVLRVESRIRSGFPPDNVAIATARGALLAAIRSGTAEINAVTTVSVRPLPYGFFDAMVREESGPAHPPADLCDGQHAECQCAQHRPSGPPEQETPKPEPHSHDGLLCLGKVRAGRCSGYVPAAPPAHGGGD